MMTAMPSGECVVAEDVTLDLLREKHRNLTAEFHLRRVLHDLANYFHAIELRVSFLTAQPLGASGDPGVLAEVVQSCTQACARIGALVDGAGTAMRERERVELQPILEQTAALVRRDGGAISLLPGVNALPPVRGGAIELAVMFVHLFDNAREAGGRICVDATSDAQHVTVCVSDDGHGICESVAPRIWKPFFTTRGNTHHGHGLAFVKQTLARLGGNIDVQPGGRGACFLITLVR
jgi:signal transduction histidine kinase